MRPHWKFWPLRLPKSITLPETNLVFNLDVTAARYPNKDAIRFFGANLTYAELKDQAEAVAGWLQCVANVAPGDRVLLYLQNCPQHVIATYAILRAQCVVVPVNPMNRAEELRHYISDAGARVVICAADLAPIVTQANAELPADQRARHLLVTRYTDAMPPSGAMHPDEAPPAAWNAWLEADPALPAGATR